MGLSRIALARFVLPIKGREKVFKSALNLGQHLRGTLFKAFLAALSTAGRVPKVNGM